MRLFGKGLGMHFEGLVKCLGRVWEMFSLVWYLIFICLGIIFSRVWVEFEKGLLGKCLGINLEGFGEGFGIACLVIVGGELFCNCLGRIWERDLAMFENGLGTVWEYVVNCLVGNC